MTKAVVAIFVLAIFVMYSASVIFVKQSSLDHFFSSKKRIKPLELESTSRDISDEAIAQRRGANATRYEYACVEFAR